MALVLSFVLSLDYSFSAYVINAHIAPGARAGAVEAGAESVRVPLAPAAESMAESSAFGAAGAAGGAEVAVEGAEVGGGGEDDNFEGGGRRAQPSVGVKRKKAKP
ncbi:hypothetical protein T492DRAFT_840131 [Pavlovales sp. CCMP2436]|nr:hypothetical protein T492DRAFT_840131 [Pavlovales sp. CCMP2436]|mmetsp:Transcript_9325/g.22428  ORF Transcript_9325/g.22428 Transcript_9325/m.22428 type:complete len:105 (+) Transcript_9325:853-1167(+)